MLRDVEVQNTPTIMVDDEEAVEHTERNRWHGEEVHRRNGFPVVAQKCKPALGRRGIFRRSFHPTGMVLSDTSKPSIRSSPWILGAPHVGFSTTMRKINSRTSFGVRLRPTCVRTPESSLQYARKPVRCQRTTVSGVTRMRDCFQADQPHRATTQKSLSKWPRLGRGCQRFRTTSCRRHARFSSRRLRRP